MTNKQDGMYLAAMNSNYRFYDIRAFFESAAHNEYGACELWCGPMHLYFDSSTCDDVSNIQQLAAAAGVKIVGLCPSQTNPKPWNMAAQTSAQQQRTYTYFCNAIDAAEQLGAHYVTVTSGWACYDETKRSAWDRSCKLMGKLAAYAQKHKVVLALEALQPQESTLVTNIYQLERYIREVNHPALKVCLDFGAMTAAHETVTQYFIAFGTEIVACHFCDAVTNIDGSMTTHLALDDGATNITSNLAALLSAGYKGPISCEVVNSRYFAHPQDVEKKNKAAFNRALAAITNAVIATSSDANVTNTRFEEPV
ncbi:sugar phosphate isomerase/epimerase family protein [Atopobium fossor]|uniref:sugar phosphate isomerase/epimerase family protein n=1 Tax=Atopobium fossor TaxID=39487 RepID=UPI00041080F0|nr:sugar phosphate isomerase/epimerase family protein [Atopobium fossor]